jgi:hypothetical protein
MFNIETPSKSFRFGDLRRLASEEAQLNPNNAYPHDGINPFDSSRSQQC